MSRYTGPTRSEFDRLSRDVQSLVEGQAATQQELAIQFKRIADLQAEIDVIRAAWTKMKRKTVKKTRGR